MPTDNVVRLLRLSSHEAERIVRDIAQDSGRVFYTHHAKEQMVKRRVTRQQVLECLSRFRIIEEPHRTAKGNWQMTIEAQSMDDWVTIALAIDNKDDTANKGDGNYIVIITVINT